MWYVSLDLDLSGFELQNGRRHKGTGPSRAATRQLRLTGVHQGGDHNDFLTDFGVLLGHPDTLGQSPWALHSGTIIPPTRPQSLSVGTFGLE